ncbi:NADH dehydrogenase [Streptomyces abyssalis]|uniref:NADH dehydrogenase n=1 Tax=Streptomyces abyssalis TaxID=933944 RepID=A0A1E7JPG8_9ACTN|nr:FAD-dependent oxidoreductase [Streptomyces abyssalis]OEU90177.1 NADH dehydrogenase [Streptomyces abyssalis]OEU94911.1 NADH dehydrogenase [Streptomyces abyssalis]OEV28771.1 NADH dehydrogenase [Streptomyces nanshensis]
MERPRVLIVGGGFAGVQCARGLERELSESEAEISLITPDDYQLYLPLLPQVASGVLAPEAVAPALRRVLRRTRIVPGAAIGVDTSAKVCVVRLITGELVNQRYDWIVLTPGSVTRTFDIPGLDRRARGMKTLAEAVWLRDHVIAQLDLAAVTHDEAERAARLRFVVAGGGYSGTETVACLQRLTSAAASRYRRVDPRWIKWHLIDHAPKLLPELGDRLGHKALQIITARGTQVSLGVSVSAVSEGSVTLTDGRTLASHTLIWTTGVTASPLIDTLGAETVHGRLAVRADLQVPGMEGVFALGDAAAVPDLAAARGAGDGPPPVCPPTAQHAMRQGRRAARNVAAVLRGRPTRPYEHRNLGLVVDLGGRDALARPLGVELSGLPARLVTRGYHVAALRTSNARCRTVANWLLDATTGNDFFRTGYLAGQPATLSGFEGTGEYPTPERVRELAHDSSVAGEC